jgi:riboflavin biosynthesis pyrimidine reductase
MFYEQKYFLVFGAHNFSPIMRLAEFSSPMIPLQEIIDFYSLEEIQIPLNRPFTWSNSLVSIDGILHFLEHSKTVGEVGLHHIHSIKEQEADWRLLNASRAFADAVLLTGQIIRDEVDVDCSVKYQDLIEMRRTMGKRGDHPIHCILSRTGDIPLDRPLFNNPNLDIWIFTSQEGIVSLKIKIGNVKANVSFYMVDNSIAEMLSILHSNGIHHLDVSSGGRVIRSFTDAQLLDEVRMTMTGQLIGPKNSKGEHRPSLYPLERKSYTPSTAPLIKWKGIRTCGDYFIFHRGVLQYRDVVL